ncbi:MAG: hypothetical protein ACFCU4_05805 [Puniceicoccaceae bacterium]
MEILTATLCDSAADYGGKLCLMGAFDTIFARKFPTMHPQCSIVLRLMMRPEDIGDHRLQLEFVNPDGHPFIEADRSPNVPFKVEALPENSYFLTKNLIFNFQGFPVPAPGQYEIRVCIDGVTETIIPLQFIDQRELAEGVGGGLER